MKRFSVMGFAAFALVGALLFAPGFVGAQASPQVVQIQLSEFAFSPNTFTAVAGQPVHIEVTNTGKFPHSMSFEKNGKFLNVFAQPIPGGKTATADFTFEEAGAWQMFCPVSNHAERGMTGTVTVLTAGAPGMPTTGGGLGDGLWLLGGLLGIILLANGLLLRRRLGGRTS